MKNNKMYPVRLEKEKLDKVIEYCKSNGRSFSKRVRELMEEIYEEIIKK